MSTEPTITTDAALSAMTQDQIAAAWKAGDIDYEAIGLERQAADHRAADRAIRIRSALRSGLSHTDAVTAADA